MATPIDYKDNFHSYHLNESLNSAKAVIPEILKYLNFSTILDVGCGIGTWLTVLKEHNKIIHGIDGHYVDKTKLLINSDQFTPYDLDYPFDLKKKFDVVLSLEVAEHIKPENAYSFISSLCLHSDIIIFSAAIPGQEGTLHYNEQLNEYWVDMFNKSGFTGFDGIRHLIWNDKRISWWYRQNLLFFIRNNKVNDEKYTELIKVSTKFHNTYVHPELFTYKTNKAEYLSNRVDYLTRILHNPIRLAWYYIRVLFIK
jgi:SAM-dependent methyltransferase